MSGSLRDTQTRACLDFDEVRFGCDTHKTSAIPTIEVFESPRRFGQLWAKVFVARPANVLSMKKVEFLREGKSWMQFDLKETVDMSKVANIIFEVNPVNRNLYAPRAFHPE